MLYNLITYGSPYKPGTTNCDFDDSDYDEFTTQEEILDDYPAHIWIDRNRNLVDLNTINERYLCNLYHYMRRRNLENTAQYDFVAAKYKELKKDKKKNVRRGKH